MKVNLKFFASLREALGPGETLDLPDGLTVGQVRSHLQSRDEAHALALGPERALRAALDQTLCHERTLVTDGAELAFFPPVTGG